MNPLSCQAIAAASDGGTPFAEATEPTSEAVTRSGVGYGGSVGVPWAGPPTGCDVAARVVRARHRDSTVDPPEPSGSCSTVPVIRYRFGSSPLAAASELTLTPDRAAIADSVSPAWTT